ncbi:MAG: PD-(D/E)XK nuclease-like domain-containing protein [Planctomycetota bacterium]|nr:PD-(D/E)XK nuclease-like domain-containing protein [Planctomycetota bacterium]
MPETETIMREPGVYYGMSFADYRRIDAVNHSLLWEMQTKSPKHALYYRDHPKEDTPALLIGRAAHSLILEPETFTEHWAVAPAVDRRTKAGKAEWAAFVEQAGEKSVLSGNDYEAIEEMAKAIESQRLHRLVRTGKAEVVVVWVDDETGILCKGRLDYLHQERGLFVIDFKTTEDARQGPFGYSIQKYGYFSQAAFYCMACEALLEQTPGYTWLVAEKKPPYAVAAYQIQAGTLNAGTEFCRRALSHYARCLETDEWPGYPDDVVPIEMPQWAIDREMQISQYMM